MLKKKVNGFTAAVLWLLSLLLLGFGAKTEAYVIKGYSATVESFSVLKQGVEFIPLLFVCEAFDVSWRWDRDQRIVTLYKQGKVLRFILNEEFIDENGKIISIEGEPYIHNGTFMVPADVLKLSWWKTVKVEPQKLFPAAPKTPMVIDTIIIDPGHGGKDCGAIAKIKEKDLVLSYSFMLKDELEKRGFKVKLTRTGDFFIPLADRAKMANETNADLFISMHANAHKDKQSNGYEVFYISENISNKVRIAEMLDNGYTRRNSNESFICRFQKDYGRCNAYLNYQSQESRLLAGMVNDEMKKTGIIRSRGAKGAKYFVLKWVEKPSVLIELGFMTNANELGVLNSQKHKKKIVCSIADSIVAYQHDFEKRNKKK